MSFSYCSLIPSVFQDISIKRKCQKIFPNPRFFNASYFANPTYHIGMQEIRKDRSRPMAVKYWTFAGLLLTDRCPARCAVCYLNLSGEEHACMAPGTALRIWRELQEASPHGCRVHLTGGEPFARWPLLIAVARECPP